MTATGKLLGTIAEGTANDVDIAVAAAQKAYDTVWGLNTPAFKRGKLLIRLAELIEENIDEIAAIESLDNGQYLPPSSREIRTSKLTYGVPLRRQDLPACKAY
jgi:acyl-CoA reductase-like NAD-dependent aldehyde dehydrogenase